MTDQKPLSVRCAEVLGWRDIAASAFGDYYTGSVPDGSAFEVLPPYGEDSPAGWSVTGPLIDRFGLELDGRDPRDGMFGAYRLDDEGEGQHLYASGPSSCAAVAEWVAQHGAKARGK